MPYRQQPETQESEGGRQESGIRRREARVALVRYARFIGDTADYVLNQLIATTIARDREFVTWRAEQPAEVAAKPNGRDHTGTAHAHAEVAR